MSYTYSMASFKASVVAKMVEGHDYNCFKEEAEKAGMPLRDYYGAYVEYMDAEGKDIFLKYYFGIISKGKTECDDWPGKMYEHYAKGVVHEWNTRKIVVPIEGIRKYLGKFREEERRREIEYEEFMKRWNSLPSRLHRGIEDFYRNKISNPLSNLMTKIYILTHKNSEKEDEDDNYYCG